MRYFLDLFAGIGGFALGAEWAGLSFDGHYFSEVDDYATRVYSNRFPDAIPLGDIRGIRGADLPAGEWIIAGGFPCQDISVAGKGAGLEGARSGLWFEYARLIGELRPRFAVMENVGALAFRGLDRVLGSLAALGYDAEWQDIRASDVGAPHRRERIWIVAYPNSDRWKPWRAKREGLEGRASPFGAGGMADAACSGLYACAQAGIYCGEKSTGSWYVDPYRLGWWATEPDVGRVAHGIPSRVDRLKCLGNSIVPQIAERIFRAIGGLG